MNKSLNVARFAAKRRGKHSMSDGKYGARTVSKHKRSAYQESPIGDKK